MPHAWYHSPADKALRDRQSRHYYDVVRSAGDRGCDRRDIEGSDRVGALRVLVTEETADPTPTLWRLR